jgi:hypothetical protein
VDENIARKGNYLPRRAGYLEAQPVSWRIALIVMLLLSLGLWWAIGAAVSSLSSFYP